MNVLRILSYITSRLDWYLFGGKQRHEEFVLQRKRNQQHCYDYPAENNRWKKVGASPVFGDCHTGTVFDPYVFCDADVFYMVVSERMTGNLLLLFSKDGIRWEKRTTVLSAQPNSWEHVVNRGCLLKVGDAWHLWYTGQNKGVSRVGHLTNKKLTSFDRTDNNRSVLEANTLKEGVSVMNPCVLWDEEKRVFRMWYAAGENYEPDAIFYAESKDGDHWEKRSEPVLAKDEAHEWEKYKVGGCDVKRMSDGRYIMFYIGYQNLDVARICYALSSDGISWKRPDDNLVIAPSRESWDADAVYKPAFVERNGEQFLWYNGRSGTDEYIGLAKRTV